jgi:diguanylate cyclase (GGDEF)-like protein
VQRKRGEALGRLGRNAEAIAALEEAARLYRQIDHRPGLEATYRALGDVLMQAGEFRRAAEALIAGREVHLQLDRERGDRELAAQRAVFEAERHDQVNRRLQAQRELADANLRNAMRVDRLKTTVIILSASLLVVALLFLMRQWRLSVRLRALALADELTGIGNRRSVLAFLDEQIRQHRDSGKPLSVAILDIDRFKQLNDRYGHAAGDEALKAVARLCQEAMRGNDKIGRTGGEEFLAVLPDATLLDAGDVGERLCDQVRKLSLDQVAPGLRITVSVGVGEWRRDDADAKTVVKRADAALYQAKAEGRDCVRLGSG